MDQAMADLRHALMTDEPLTLEALGGATAVLAAASELTTTPELPVVVSLLVQEWDKLPDRAAAASLVADSVRVARPFELDDVLDVVLMSADVVPDVAAQLEKPLRDRAQGEDAAAGIALEAWLRLTLGQWTRSPFPLLAALDEHAAIAAEAEAEALDETFLHRLVRCLGAAGEHWRGHDKEIRKALEGLLHHELVDDSVAFELAMLQLHAGLEEEEPEAAVQALRDARRNFALTSQYEDRIDADIFGLAIDLLLSFASGSVPSPVEVAELRDLVYEYRLNRLAELPHWRQPRADTAVQWLELVDNLARLQNLDRGWLYAGNLIGDVARVYRAHRTITLVQPADVVSSTDSNTDQNMHPAVRELLQPRLIAAVAVQKHSLDLLDQWLERAAEGVGDPEDAEAIRQIRQEVQSGDVHESPKGPSVDISALRDHFGLSDEDSATAQAVFDQFPDFARKFNYYAATRLETSKVDVSIYFQDCYAQICRDIRSITNLAGERQIRVEQLALELLKYTYWRGSVTAGGKLAASFQRRFTNDRDAPKESEFADDLHKYLAMGLPGTTYKEVSNVANGRVDLIVFFGSVTLVVECKRELKDASRDHLVAQYVPQAAEYGWADPAAGFLAVLDLTEKNRRVQLGQSVWVVPVEPLEEGGRKEAVVVTRVQANLPPPSHLSTGAATRGRIALQNPQADDSS